MKDNKHHISYFRNFIFGVEDSLVSTVGLLSGIAIANIPRQEIFLTGVVLIFVEAFSMGAGSYLSEYSAKRYERDDNTSDDHSFFSGVIMFFSYFFSGFIPLFPYLIWEIDTALPISVFLSIFFLFILGVIGAKISNISIIRNGLRIAVIGGIAIMIGLSAGLILSEFTNNYSSLFF
ncbi:MAG: VIT1/CCC1 transporter family protein [Candidatus Paceibacterota bacterium]|jgi:VIT1/CCC1 family predicted Fe2+/Mn2+ transporter